MRANITFRAIKGEIRVLAWDDGPFKFGRKGRVVLIGVIFRGGQSMDGLLKTEIAIDGTDAETKIIKLTNRTKHKGQLRLLMTDGITFGGFNTINIKSIYEKTGLPVIVVNRKKPNFPVFIKTLEKLPHAQKRIKAVQDAGPVHFVSIRGKRICYQCAGLGTADAAQIIRITATRGLLPEPLRIAHLIATGLVLGESIGRA